MHHCEEEGHDPHGDEDESNDDRSEILLANRSPDTIDSFAYTAAVHVGVRLLIVLL